MLIIAKMKIMKLSVSRRLHTWDSTIFVEQCPFGCNIIDDEEHALLYCNTAIIKNVKKSPCEGSL